MHPAHDPPPDSLLNNDRGDIDNHIDAAHQCPECENHGNSDPECIHERNTQQCQPIQDPRCSEHTAAAEACRQRPRDRHRCKGSDPNTEEQKAEHVIPNRKPLPQERDKRCP